MLGGGCHHLKRRARFVRTVRLSRRPARGREWRRVDDAQWRDWTDRCGFWTRGLACAGYRGRECAGVGNLSGDERHGFVRKLHVTLHCAAIGGRAILRAF